MKLNDIRGRPISIDVSHKNYPPKNQHRSNRQGYCLDLIREVYPRDIIIEEFTIPGSRMSLDFFIPSRRLAIEIQGEQHQSHINFFHGDRRYSKSYGNQKIRDSQKSYWCENNEIRLVEIHPCDIDVEVKRKIKDG